jgi:hypothetical protein
VLPLPRTEILVWKSPSNPACLTEASAVGTQLSVLVVVQTGTTRAGRNLGAEQLADGWAKVYGFGTDTTYT